ncbi:IclR family transcriptional regulator, partial [Streptomyces sp. NTH33]
AQLAPAVRTAALGLSRVLRSGKGAASAARS